MPWWLPAWSSPAWRSPRPRRASSPGPRSTPTPPPSPASSSCGPRNGAAGMGENGRSMAEFLIITGLSGAGRSQAADTFEDLGWFVIDNMPTALITKVADLVTTPGSETQRVALVVGRAGGHYDELRGALEQLRKTGRGRVLY